jgi:hypothetical protein
VKNVKELIEYIRNLVLNAKGNAVSFTLKQAKKALGVKSKSEERALRAALEALVGLGLLQKTPGKRPRYLLQRGTPLWSALERGCTDLLVALADRRPQTERVERAARRRLQPAGGAGRLRSPKTVKQLSLPPPQKWQRALPVS